MANGSHICVGATFHQAIGETGKRDKLGRKETFTEIVPFQPDLSQATSYLRARDSLTRFVGLSVDNNV